MDQNTRKTIDIIASCFNEKQNIVAILSPIEEYIGRMYIETQNRPVYIEKESGPPAPETDPDTRVCGSTEKGEQH